MKSTPELRRTFRVIASPRARRALRQKGFEAKTIRGSGPGGRILESDVLAHVPRQVSAPQNVAAVFHLRAEIDASRLQQLQSKFSAHANKKHKVEIALSHFIAHALAAALRAVPSANLVREIGAFAGASEINLALEKDGTRKAIANADKLNLIEIARAESASEAANCATGLQIAPSARIDEWTGTLAIESSSVLAVGSLAPRAFVRNGALAVCPTLKLCLSCDDAVPRDVAAAFLEQIIEFLEQPEAIVFS